MAAASSEMTVRMKEARSPLAKGIGPNDRSFPEPFEHQGEQPQVILPDSPAEVTADAAKPRDIALTPQHLGMMLTRLAIGHYRAATALRDRFASVVPADEAFDDWGTFANDQATRAECELVSALMAWEVEGDPHVATPSNRASMYLSPRGVVCDGWLYLAVHVDDGWEHKHGEKRPDGRQAFDLVVAKSNDIFDFDTSPMCRAGACPKKAAPATPADPISSAYAEYLRSIEANKTVERSYDYHQAEATRLEGVGLEMDHASRKAETALIRAVLEASGRPMPDSDEWYYSTGPIWTARAAGKLFGVCRSRNGDWSDNLDDLIENLSLAVMDADATEGGVR